MRIGILTGGGDCPGLNAVIRAVFKSGQSQGHDLLGFCFGWRGVIEDETMALDEDAVRDILHQGGTILRTSGVSPFHTDDGAQRAIATLERHGVEALVVIGGEGTMSSASRMWREHRLPVIGVPKTIDNDLPGTDVTFGFDSALTIATASIDRLHTTAESHNRVMVCEVMGRTAGWLTLFSGIAGGANVILLPEQDKTIEDAAAIIQKRHDAGKSFSLVVVGEGYKLRSGSGLFDDHEPDETLDAYGYPRLGGVARHVAWGIEQLTGYETRVTILGHVQRGGSPTAWDRVLASRFGMLAAQLAHRGEYGKLVALRGDQVVAVDLTESEGEARRVPPSYFELAENFMG